MVGLAYVRGKAGVFPETPTSANPLAMIALKRGRTAPAAPSEADSGRHAAR